MTSSAPHHQSPFIALNTPMAEKVSLLPFPHTVYPTAPTALGTEIVTGLVIDGDIPTPKIYSLLDLKGLTREKVKKTMVSAEGWHSTHVWGGVWLSTLMQALRGSVPGLDSKYLLQTNCWGQQEVLRLSPDLEKSALICDQIDGAPLPSTGPHACGPLWLVVFDRYSYKGLEGLSRLSLLNEPPRLEQRSDALGLDPLGMIPAGETVDAQTGQRLKHSGV